MHIICLFLKVRFYKLWLYGSQCCIALMADWLADLNKGLGRQFLRSKECGKSLLPRVNFINV